MSRIEFGPEDNPNIVFDENGDLVFEDADGNVIATYTQDQTTEVQTLNADEQNITEGRQIRVFVGDNNPYVETYQLADYSDIGAAINQAIQDYAPGVLIRVPSGAFEITDKIVIDSERVTLKGNGRRRTYFTKSDGAIDGISVAAQHVRLEGFRIQGSGDGARSDSCVSIDSSSNVVSGCEFENVEVANAGGIGFDATEDTESIFDLTFENCWFAGNNSNGVVFNGASQVDFYGGWVVQNGNRGVTFTASNNINLNGVSWGVQSDYGLRLNNTTDVQIDAAHVENTQTNQGVLIEGCSSVTIRNLSLTDCDADLDITDGVVQTIFGNNSNCDVTVRSSSGNLEFLGQIRTPGTVTFEPGAYRVLYPNDPSHNGEAGVSGSGGNYSLSFDTSFPEKPKLDVTQEADGTWWVSSWSTDGNGYYDGATVEFRDASGSTHNPTFSWRVTT